MPYSYQNEFAFLKKQAHAAGAVMRNYYGGDYRVYTKPDRSKVTDVDLAISKIVQEAVAAEFPNVVLYSEESENDPIDPARDHFIIDELDGTSYFIDHIPGFSHQAAFYKGNEGLVVGLVYYPLDDILIYAIRGQGAYLEEKGVAHRLPRRTISKEFEDLHFAHPARYRGDKYWDLFRHLGIDAGQVVRTTALRTLQFARKKLDVAIFLTRRIPEWDWAGEKVILEELGMNHSFLDGSPVRFGEQPAMDNPGYLLCPKPFREPLIQEALQWTS